MNAAFKKSSPLTQLLKSDARIINILKPGDLVEAILIRRSGKGVYFDLGAFGTGIVYGQELINAKEIVNKLNPGNKILAKIIDSENEEGYTELSLAEAGKQKVWQELKELAERGEIITVKITGANSGGLTTKVKEVGGFIPVSQLSADHYPKVDEGDRGKILEELKKLMDTEMKVKVLDVNPRTSKLILSEREIVGENVKELLSKYKVGDVVDGIISGVADFGAFIRFADNPKIEGLIHISELEHRLIDNPKEVVKVDDVVKAKIIEIKDGRVSLSLKALKEDPWQQDVEKKIQADQEVSGEVAKFYPFGAFVNLKEGLQGLVHVSEFGGIEEMKKQLEIGKSYQFKVDSVKAAEKRIILKIKK